MKPIHKEIEPNILRTEHGAGWGTAYRCKICRANLKNLAIARSHVLNKHK